MARRTIGQEGYLFVAAGNKSDLDDLSKLVDWRAVDVLMAPISAAAKGEPGWPLLCLLQALPLTPFSTGSKTPVTTFTACDYARPRCSCRCCRCTTTIRARCSACCSMRSR